MDKEAVKRLKPFLSAIKKKFKPSKVILFGSRARNDFIKESDYDLLIVANFFDGMNYPERITKSFELLNYPIDIELVCLTPKELEIKSRQMTIVAEAVKEGILLSI